MIRHPSSALIAAALLAAGLLAAGLMAPRPAAGQG
jgi:hypothetical protein